MAFITADLLNIDCSSLTGWTDVDAGSGESSISGSGQQWKLYMNGGSGNAGRQKDIGTLPSTFTIEFVAFCNVLDNYADGTLQINLQYNGSYVATVNFSADAVKAVYNGGVTNLGNYVVTGANHPQKWRLECTCTTPSNATMNFYLDGTLKNSNVPISYSFSGTSGDVQFLHMGSASGKLVYIDYIKIGTGLGEFAPVFTTSAASSIAATSATLGGNITELGSSPITEKGVVYSKTSVNNNPEIGGTGVTKLSTTGDATGAYSLSATGLSSNTGYSFKAYTITTGGTSYGSVATFTTLKADPTVTTQSVSNKTSSGMTGNGNITSLGDYTDVTRRGFVYKLASSSGDPTVGGLGCTAVYDENLSGYSTGAYTKAITGMSYSTEYKVRAYIYSPTAGTVYGSTVTVTTLGTIPTITTQAPSNRDIYSLTGNGNISSTGGENVTRRGFCYLAGIGTPTTASPSVFEDNSSWPTGVFNLGITGLASNTLYSIRAFAINSQGTAYGTVVTETTKLEYPAVTTETPDTPLTTSFMANGNITYDGGGEITVRGFCYIEGSGTPTLSDDVVSESEGYGEDYYSLEITGLSSNTLYSIRAFATNSTGTSYGSTIEVTTAIAAPTVATSEPLSITINSVLLGGLVTSHGGTTVTERGVCWIEGSGTPTTANNKVYEAAGDGFYSLPVVGLSHETLYSIRAYAINSEGTWYGSVLSFTTLKALPTVETDTETNLSSISFTANGNITSIGYSGFDVTERGFVYMLGAVGTPTIGGLGCITVSEVGTFGSGLYGLGIIGLAIGTNYRVRSYAANAYGIEYGNTITVETAAPLTVSTQAVTNISPASFTAHGTVVSSASLPRITRRGFCYKEKLLPPSDPTISDSVVYEDSTEGFLAGAYSLTAHVSSNLTYLVRAYAINSEGLVYGETVEVTTTIIYSLVVTPTLPVINIGETVQLVIEGLDSTGAKGDATYLCSFSEEDFASLISVPDAENEYSVDYTPTETIATVDANGLVTGVSGGIAKIFATVSGISAWGFVFVQPPGADLTVGGAWGGELPPGTVIPDLVSVELDFYQSMLVNSSQQAFLTGYYDDSPSSSAHLPPVDITWSSSNTEVATIDSEGLIVALASGITFIKAWYTILTSPEQHFYTLKMLKVEALDTVEQTNFQYIPLTPQPNQRCRITVATSVDRSINLDLILCWNEGAGYWTMTIINSSTGEYYVDSIPLFAGILPTVNLLAPYAYLNIGSCYIVNISGLNIEEGKPNSTNLGIDYVLIWGYTP